MTVFQLLDCLGRAVSAELGIARNHDATTDSSILVVPESSDFMYTASSITAVRSTSEHAYAVLSVDDRSHTSRGVSYVSVG